MSLTTYAGLACLVAAAIVAVLGRRSGWLVPPILATALVLVGAGLILAGSGGFHQFMTDSGGTRL